MDYIVTQTMTWWKHHRLCDLLLLDVGTQFENILLAGCLELVGEAEIFDLNL